MYLKVMDKQRDGAFTVLRVGDRVTLGEPSEEPVVIHEFQDPTPESERWVHWLHPDTGMLEAARIPIATAYLLGDHGQTIERL